LELQQSWCTIVFLPLFDHSTAAVIVALATLRECADIPEAAKTITANSCWESNFRRALTVITEEWIEKGGISLKAMGLVLRALVCLFVCLVFLTATVGVAQRTSLPPGPIPPAIAAARRIFVSNAGADSGLFPEPFSGDTDRGYTQFFAALKTAGQFDLVADPSDADLVLELQLIAPNGPSSGNKQNGASDPVPMFRLRIYDRKTHYILWTLTASIEVALLQKTHDRNFDQALSNILLDFQQLTGRLPTAPH
jgi:hypothetical protein